MTRRPFLAVGARSDRRGWTLVEALVVAMLVGLFSLGATRLVSFFFRGVFNLEKRLPPQQTLQAALGLIHKDLASCPRSSFMNLLPDPGFEWSPYRVGATTLPNSLRTAAAPANGWWNFAPVIMNPTTPGLNKSARLDSSSVNSDNRSWLMMSVGGAAGNAEVGSGSLTLGDGTYLYGGTVRVHDPAAAAFCRAEIVVRRSGVLWVSTATLAGGWTVLKGSFTVAGGSPYGVFLRTVNIGGGNTCRGYFDDVFLSTHSLAIGQGAPPTNTINFLRFDNTGNPERVVYNVVQVGGKWRFERSVTGQDGTTRTVTLPGVLRLETSWDGGDAVVAGVDRPITVRVTACGASANCADPASAEIQSYPVSR